MSTESARNAAIQVAIAHARGTHKTSLKAAQLTTASRPKPKPPTIAERVRALAHQVNALELSTRKLAAGETKLTARIDPELGKIVTGLQQLGYSGADAHRLASVAITKMRA
jgi:hypothetical protein